MKTANLYLLGAAFVILYLYGNDELDRHHLCLALLVYTMLWLVVTTINIVWLILTNPHLDD